MSSSHDIPTTINGGPHHRNSVSNMTTVSDFPDVLGNDELAANLIKCATYVKFGDTQHPLLRQTIKDLTFFVTGRQVVPPSTTTTSTATAAATIKNQDSPASSVLAKKSVSQFASGMITKLGLQAAMDDTSVGAGSVSVHSRNEAQKSASSMKHAENARADIQRTLGTSSTSLTGNSTSSNTKSKKPPFQRPTNTASSLIANGWVEQQRRSKLRVVWKEVLASLVEGRKPGEETTLWIQREYYSNATNKIELEALHQIPIKLIRHIEYQDYTTDHRFLIKVHGMHEDFMFRCEKSEEAAQNWVITIRSVLDILKDPNRPKNGDSKIPIRAALEQQAHLQQERIRQTSNESAASKNDDTKFSPPTNVSTIPTNVAPQPHPQQYQSAPKAPSQVASTSGSVPPSVTTPYSHQPPSTSIPHMSVSEMRAIAHGAGIQTHGMERGELELIVQQIANSLQRTEVSGGVSPPPPPQPPTSQTHFAMPPQQPTPPIPTRPVVADPTLQRSTSPEDETVRQQRQQQEAIDRQQQIEEAARRRKLAEDAARNRAAAEAQQAYVRQQQEAIDKQQRAEEERKRLESERLRREEEEHQRRVAEQQAAEQRRRVEEQQRQQQEQWKQQQGNWQKQQAEEEQRRRADEARLAEEKRRQEEAYRAQHQQWQQQQQQQQQAHGFPPNQWQQPHPSAPPPFGQPLPPPPPQYGPGTGQGPPQHPGGQPNQQHGNSQVDQKYAKMVTQVGDNGQQRSLQIIKHGILVDWALQRPAMQILRPIEALITSVHDVFPPKYGVPGHEHFNKWSIITLPEVLSGTQPDDEKLSKAVKKLRFVLHPDKLPREFTEEQSYMCRMIWDIVSDAFEDHKKREEELAWMR